MPIQVHKDNTMEIYWEQYQRKVYGCILGVRSPTNNVNDDQLEIQRVQAKQLKEVFYSAFALLLQIMGDLSSGYSEEVAMKTLDRLNGECVDFVEKTLHKLGA